MSFVVPTNFRQLPPVWEMSQPFQIDITGEVSYDSDPVLWAQNHILAVLLTNPGERVMRPTYGAGIYNFVWDKDDPLNEATIINEVNQAVATFEPNITIHQIEFIPQPDFSGIAYLDIMFSVGATTPHRMTVSLGGTGIEITARART